MYELYTPLGFKTLEQFLKDCRQVTHTELLFFEKCDRKNTNVAFCFRLITFSIICKISVGLISINRLIRLVDDCQLAFPADCKQSFSLLFPISYKTIAYIAESTIMYTHIPWVLSHNFQGSLFTIMD